jgi:multidrug efflux pump subunit AcrA (membrane-fusion protein)
MKTKNIILLIMIAAMSLLIVVFNKKHFISTQALSQKGHHDIWYCPMHTFYTSDHPGHCPICGMDLVKKEEVSKEEPLEKESTLQDPKVEGYAAVSVTAQKQQLMGVRVAVVGKESVVKTIRAAGRVAYDPDLYKAETDYVESYISYTRLNRRLNKGSYVIKDAERKLKESALELLHMGATEATIAQLQRDNFPDHSLLVTHEGGAQIFAEVFGQDLGFIDVGQKAIVEVPDYHEIFNGVVQSIDPIVDSTSQTTRVRIYVTTNKELHSNMFVRVRMPVALNDAIVVLREAVMDTGLRKVVFVQKDEGTFEPRNIQTGWETDDGIEVTSGLKEGERIVVSGNFLLDSESRVQAGLEADTGAATGGKDHD